MKTMYYVLIVVVGAVCSGCGPSHSDLRTLERKIERRYQSLDQQFRSFEKRLGTQLRSFEKQVNKNQKDLIENDQSMHSDLKRIEWELNSIKNEYDILKKQMGMRTLTKGGVTVTIK